MKQYLALMQKILAEGTPKSDRTGTGTLSIFGHQMRFNLQDGFPLVTTKKCHLRSIIYELLWFLKGDTNIKYSRRLIISAWNVGELDQMALAPCHAFFQFYVVDGKLSCQLYQRSCDVFLGLPFNIASYSLLIHMIAQQCNLDVGDFVWTGGDTHLYSNHLEQTHLQLSRTPRALPKLVIRRKPPTIFDYEFEDFEIIGYDPYPAIKAPVAV